MEREPDWCLQGQWDKNNRDEAWHGREVEALSISWNKFRLCPVWPWARCLTSLSLPSFISMLELDGKRPQKVENVEWAKGLGVMAGWIWGRISLSPFLPVDCSSCWSQISEAARRCLEFEPSADPSSGLFQGPVLMGQRKSSGMSSTPPLTGM